MKKLFKILTILITISLLEIIYSCCNEFYKIEYREIDIGFLDNSGRGAIILTSDSVRQDYFGIRLEIKSDVKYSLNSRDKMELIQSCYALTCEETYIKNEKIVGLSIYSSVPFNDFLSATDSINDFFAARYANDTTFMPVPLNTMKERINSIIFDWNFHGSEEIDFFLIKPIELHQPAKFKIQIKLNNGKEFLDSTNFIQIY